MKRLVLAVGLGLTVMLAAGCANVTDQAIQETYASLEAHGITEDQVQVTTVAGNGDIHATVVVKGCEVMIADNGYELTILSVEGISVGYPIDLENDAEEQLKRYCEHPNDVNRVTFW